MNDACDCDRIDELAEELALGAVTGRERADALAHLETCHRCRTEVASLTEVAESILLVCPPVEPDPGFEQRVLARLAAAHRDRPDAVAPLSRHRRRRLPPAAVLAVAALLLILAGIGLALSSGDGAPDDVVALGDMRAANGDVVGVVALRDGDHGTRVEMDLPGWDGLLADDDPTAPDSYWLEVTTADGTTKRVALDRGDRAWDIAVAVEADDVSAVAIVDGTGFRWCRAVLA